MLSEFDSGTATLSNADGSMGYRNSGGSANTAKAGIRLQALSLIGVALNTVPTAGGPTPQTTVDYINAGWKGRSESFQCSSTGPGAPLAPFQTNAFRNNFGCLYAQFNVFKGLKLYNVVTLPNSSRGDLDWHKEYQDYLVQTQSAPTTTTGGGWGGLSFSCCSADTNGESALALLILSPTPTILPDPVKFASLGLTPSTDTNFVDEQHTVTAHAEGFCAPDPCEGPPIQGLSIDFEVLSGPSTGATGSDVTDANGDATFTYDNPTDTPGTDTIQATIRNTALVSNIVDKIWVPRAVDVNWDLKFCSLPNAINCRRLKGNIPLTIFGSAELDVSLIDIPTLRLALASDPSTSTGAPTSTLPLGDRGSPGDVDNADTCVLDEGSGLMVENPDGKLDLDVGFSAADVADLVCPIDKKSNSADLVITGTLFDGTALNAVNTQFFSN